MTFDEYYQSAAWREAVKRSERKRKKNNLIGIAMCAVVVVVLLLEIGIEFIPDEVLEENAYVKVIILCVSCCVLIFFGCILLYAKIIEVRAIIDGDLFRAQALFAREIDLKSFYLNGTLEIGALFECCERSNKTAVLKFVLSGATEQIEFDISDKLLNESFLRGVLMIAVGDAVHSLGGRGERLDAVYIRYSFSQYGISDQDREKRVFLMKKGRRTYYGNMYFRRIARLRAKTKP